VFGTDRGNPSSVLDRFSEEQGSDTNTLLRWLQMPEFQSAYRTGPPRSLLGKRPRGLQQASGAAVSTLLKIMVDPNSPASTRVRAADSVLDHGAKAIEFEEH